MSRKLYLPMITEIDPSDTILYIRKPGPIIRGEGDTNLACGSCKSVLATGCTTAEIARNLKSKGRVLLECQCGATSLVDPAVSVH